MIPAEETEVLDQYMIIELEPIVKPEVDVQETENDIDVKVNYELEVNYEHMADCCITMNIKSKDAGDFRITGAE